DATKAGFTAGMLAQDLESLHAGAPTAAWAVSGLSDASMALEAAGMSAEMAQAVAADAIADGFWTQYDQAFEAAATVNYSTANGLGVDFSANFMGDTNTDMNYAFYNAMGPGGENISLTSALGATMLSGHCASFPTENSSTIMAMDDMSASGTMTRATLWQYMAMVNETIPDFETTIARDWAMCAGIGMTFAAFGGGDDMWMMDTTGESVN
ncbi:MAG: hypothetical protein ACPH9B_08100, partial [Poseidonia sp.]